MTFVVTKTSSGIALLVAGKSPLSESFGIFSPKTVADPGFPQGGAPTPRGGAPTYDFAKISQKLYEIERIWTPRGARVPCAPPLRSATAKFWDGDGGHTQMIFCL